MSKAAEKAGLVDRSYLFKCLLLANFLQYLEAGAVPALLLQLSNAFHMGAAKQGLLGGVVYLSLSLGGPFAGYLLRTYDHKVVVSCAVAANMVFTLLWALTPVGYPYSANVFISMRFLMGLCQCVVCVFLPLWTNENAPNATRTSWMSYLQASVPFGVMTGYIIASVLTNLAAHRDTCAGLLCWRWSFLIEIMLLTPLYLSLYFIPKEDLQVCVSGDHAPPQTPRQGSADQSDNNRRVSLDGVARMQSPNGHAKDHGLINETPPPRPQQYQQSTPRRGHLTPEERGQYSTWRKAAISASLVDPMSTRYALKKSCEDIPKLGPEVGAFPALPGLRRYETEDDVTAGTASEAPRPATAPRASGSTSNRRHNPHHTYLARARHALHEEEDKEDAKVANTGAAAAAEAAEAAYFLGATLEDDLLVPAAKGPLTIEKPQKVRSISSDAAVQRTRAPRTAPHRPRNRREPSKLGERRLSLQEWFIGSLPSLPYSTHGPAAEETKPMLREPRSRHQSEDSRYGSLDASALEEGRPSSAGVNTRRSLDHSFRQSLRNSVARNPRRSSVSSAVAGLMQQQRPTGGRAKPAEPMQYESFKDIARKSENGAAGHARKHSGGWGVFSMLGIHGQRNRSRSNSGGDASFLDPFSRSNKSRASDPRGSPFPTTPAAPGHARQHSADDSGVLDVARLEDRDSPSPLPPRTRSRTLSNPKEYSGPLMRNVPSNENLAGGNRDEGASAKRQPRGDIEDGGYRSEDDSIETNSNEGDQYDFEDEGDEEDEYSVEFDEAGYLMEASDSESEEPWGGMTPPPILGDAEFGTPYQQRPSEAPSTAGSRTSAAGTASGLRGAKTLTPGTVAASVAAIGRASVEAEPLSTWQEMARWLRHTHRYILSVVASVRALLSIKTYRCLLGAMSALYFTVTGVHFWGTKYLTVVLHSPLPLVNTLFIVCAATGPTLGVFFGGWIIDRNGGYKGTHQRVVALELCSTFGVLACLFSIPITLFSNIFVVVSFLWVMLFFGGAILPACSGIVVSIIPRPYRPTSSALALMVFNMFGYFLSLLLSGYLMQVLDDYRASCDEACSMTWGFRLVLFWCFISVYFLISALFSAYQRLKDRDRGHGRPRRRSSYQRRLSGGSEEQ